MNVLIVILSEILANIAIFFILDYLKKDQIVVMPKRRILRSKWQLVRLNTF